MTNMHPNSLAAFEKLDLTNNQAIVLSAFRRGEGTDEQIALRLKWGVNRVCPRVGELLALGKLEVIGEATSEFGNKVRVCKLVKFRERLF
jgi:hypothetical protein